MEDDKKTDIQIPEGEVWIPQAKPEVPKTEASAPRRRNPIWNPGSRRNSREWALQILFQADANPPTEGIDEAIAEFWELQQVENEPPEIKLKKFTEKIVRGVWEHRDEIDAKISGYLTNWTIDRIGGVDRNVLRMAMFELFFCEETPPVVVLNEAVDVAKFFSTRDSGKFVNGVLDRAIKDVPRPSREVNKPHWLQKKEKH